MTERMWRVVAIFRVVTLVYAAALILGNHDRYVHPALGLAALAVMTGWTMVTVTAYARPAGRRRLLIAADVAVAAALVVATRWVDSPARISAGMQTLPSVWAAGPVLACAVAGGPWAGIAGGFVIAAADLAERPHLYLPGTLDNIVLLLIAGGVGGYVVRLGLQAERAVDRVARTEAVMAERDRIARGIHDSVLQVLALVSRRGQALGGEAADLGRLAAEQEAVLRRLVIDDHLGAPAGAIGPWAASGEDRPADLRAVLERFSAPQIIVSCPASAVLLPPALVAALGEATAAVLDNVGRHAGSGARAWVLVEEQGTCVNVSIRDDGTGFPQERLASAAAEGRLGIPHSIVGRLREAGGRATVTSVPSQGTEVELVVPRP